ncbi:hypothetical protein P152DRAFT_445954 [Eremomyces bilateralis CBS 781.70]|uniref:F-box domain-containing protein n=1 Tax=Eremomyces bilateralis CBS 781.70 TaxID=1392243 RepID=A0A6G1GEI1_9PEZI|nr:uncharacterized protein P152DRAFT_445954 [Eremomyces bilateralis CBS 781.70]KAF1816279.1 hypothetical protein P152DRAFT_445954 [Eremomyces bilateralis CBS 781.70]
MSAAPTGNRELNEQSPILRLSDELLELILDYASIGYGASTFSVPDTKEIHSSTGEEMKQKSDDGLQRCPHPNVRPSHEAFWLPLVCRRFRSIFQPLFYRHIEIWLGISFPRRSDRLASLHATLRGNPALAQRCHTLMIEQYCMETLEPEQYIEVFCEILSLTANLRCLKLEGTAPFTTVDIGDFSHDELILSTIVNWCKTIEHFAYKEYNNIEEVAFPPDDDQTFFNWLLARHRSTVRSLAIGSFHRLPGRPLDVMGLPALETLTIRWPTFTANPRYRIDDLDATDAANALLAPKLRNFTLVMETFDWFARSGACPGGTHGTELDQWMGEFMEIARQRQSPLQRIQIVYDGRREGCIDGCNFPENVMDPLFEAAKQLDFALMFKEETIDSWH